MATRRNREDTDACQEILAMLKDDHKRVKKAYKEFEKLDPESDAERCQEIVQQVLQELTVHAALEEEFLYPAIRGEVDDDLVDEAEVEHETMHNAIEQLQGMGPDDEKYAARFTVLCEYVLHHVKEEEGEMFPQIEKADLEWQALAQEINERREMLLQDGEAAAAGEDAMDDDDMDEDAPARGAGSGEARAPRRS